MKVCAISDLHLREPDLPEADLGLIAGDLTFRGLLKEYKKSMYYLQSQREKFKDAYCTLGNHDGDLFLELGHREEFERESGWKILIDETVEVQGLKIFGSPYTPEFCNWFWSYESPTNRWRDFIQEGTDIVVTHGPPYRILDLVERGENVGCYDLAHRLRQVRPKAVVFGHIHSGYGQFEEDGTTYYNVSHCDEQYFGANPPTVFEI